MPCGLRPVAGVVAGNRAAIDNHRIELFAGYRGSLWIAHAVVSLRLGDDARVGMPVEARKEIGEEYSAVRDFFGNMPGDTGDLVRVRTNNRKVKARATPESTCKLFLE